MKVQIDELTFEKMLKGTKSFVSASYDRPILTYIRLDVKTDELVFSALDGYRATRIHVSKESPEEFTVYFPPFDFKASKSGSRQITISKENDVCKIEVETNLFKEAIYQFKQPTKNSIDIHKVYENQNFPKRAIAFNAAYLSQALNAIKGITTDCQKFAVIEFGENPNNPILIKNRDKNFCVEELVLPICFKEN